MANLAGQAADFEFISIHVRNPRTHLLRGWPVYTDFEIVVLTNSMIFAKQNTKVRRRFSEFMWLWKHLSRHTSLSLKLPSLPTKRKVFGRFSKRFLEERRSGLQEALASLSRITPILADSIFHLFIQSNLTRKEMENFISGRDKRDLVDIIDPAGEYQQNKDRRCTCHSTVDSGYSGSVPPDEGEDSRGIFDDVSSWVASQQHFASNGLMGNGWSSGYACQTTCKSRSNSQLRGFCPSCSDKQSTPLNRRLSLTHNVASVLPGGKLMIAPSAMNCPKIDEANCESSDGKSGSPNPYEGDNELEFDLSDYEIVKDEPFIRVRDWLNSQNDKSVGGCNSSDEEDILDACQREVRVKEYDVLSIPCARNPNNCKSATSMGYHSNEGSVRGDAISEEAGDDNDSEYTVLHSSIGGLDWKDRDEFSSSCDSEQSAAVFLTYDVVEMIEVRYTNVV